MATDDSGSTTPALLAEMDDLVVEALLLAIPSFRYQLPSRALSKAHLGDTLGDPPTAAGETADVRRR